MIRCDYIFVTGCRRVTDAQATGVARVLAPFSAATLYHGGCRQRGDSPAEPYRGVDGVAHGLWPPDRRVAMEANWRAHGRAAGPIRNGEMRAVAAELRGRGDRVLLAAFPGNPSPGTLNCIEQFAGFPMIVIPLDQLC